MSAPAATGDAVGTAEPDLTQWRLATRLPDGWSGRLYLVVSALILASLGVSLAVVSGADFAGLASLERWFYVDREMGVPAWFSTVLLFACAQALWRLSTQSRRGIRRRWHKHEWVLAAVFCYLSIDELTEIHEQTITPLQQTFGLTGALSFSWVIIAVPLCAVLGLFMVGYLRALPALTRWALVLSGVMFVGGAAGIEMIGALLSSSSGAATPTYAVVVTLEEGLEMAALVLFLGAVTALRRANETAGLTTL